MMIKMLKDQILVIELEFDMAERNFSPKEKSVIIVVIAVIKIAKRFEGAIRPNSFGYPLRGLRAHWVRN